MASQYEVVIGLEIHAQLLSQSKLFSWAPTAFGSGDNINVTPICAGMPGALPVMNEEVVRLAIKTGLALHCEIKEKSVFARKQYFYPDLPKGYQISQFDQPICQGGYVEFYLDEQKHKVQLERAHLEEDAGKSVHQGGQTLINLNRAGVPLLEIVSAPVIHSSREAAAFARAVRQILIYSEVCDGNLEEGSMRCDCNVSIRPSGQKELGTRVELKNINSFRFIEKALDYEIQRQADCLDHGEKLVQETRLYDSTKNKTFPMRTKEEAMDYRYFPDPDLPDLILNSTLVEEIKKTLPEQPLVRLDRFLKQYDLSFSEADHLTSEHQLADYFEKVAEKCNDPKRAAHWITGHVLAKVKGDKKNWSEISVSSDNLGSLLGLIADNTISGKIAKQVFDVMWNDKRAPMEVISDLGLQQISDEPQVLEIIAKILSQYSDKVEQYRGGKEKLYGFFVGQVMKATKGQANPDVVNRLLKEELGKKS